MPKGGFGNLIALPLQKTPREQDCSVFVDEDFQPYTDQWAYLASIQSMATDSVEQAITDATGGAHPLDVTFITEEDQTEPWKVRKRQQDTLPGPMPTSLSVTAADLVYFEKACVPQPLLNRLIRLAAFPNPEFFKAQAMRFPVWDKPRIIGCADNHPKHIALPRGCLDAARKLLRDNGIRCEVHDERFSGKPLDVTFSGTLRADQEEAVAAMLRHDTGVLCAPTAFGKTVTAAALIARRGVNTLVLVHRTELLRQHPIIFMQCGPIRHTASRPDTAPRDLEVIPRIQSSTIDLPAKAGIQDVFRHVATAPPTVRRSSGTRWSPRFPAGARFSF
ncbi:type III restriction enzyme, res subunit [Burkholderia thailandensis E254]|nr:type III restriction enzyme, res subunit [Burkholderia thailandensis E254]